MAKDQSKNSSASTKNNPAQAAAAAAPATEAPKTEKKKWYEDSKGWGFTERDVIFIGPDHPNGVANRFAEVIGPSEKPNHVKARMQNEKTGELQRSEVVIDNQHLSRVSQGGMGGAIESHHGDKFNLDEKGIYRTKAQLDEEAKKMAARNKNKTENDQNDVPQAQ